MPRAPPIVVSRATVHPNVEGRAQELGVRRFHANRRKTVSRRKQKILSRVTRTLSALGSTLWHRARTLWANHQRKRGIRVEVLVADERWRRALETEVRQGLRRLAHALDNPLASSGEVAVVVQHAIKTDRQLAGCYQVGELGDGQRFALIRIALQVNGRRLDLDELLATLAEQWIGLAIQQSSRPSVLVPIDLEPAGAAEVRPLTALRPDPLNPHPNGHTQATRAQTA